MNTPLSLKLEHALGMEESFFMILQVYYDIREEKRKQSKAMGTPDLSKISPGLFWDTDISKIDWQRQRRSVIKRIFERGNDQEKNEIIRFYGADVVAQYISINNKDR